VETLVCAYAGIGWIDDVGMISESGGTRHPLNGRMCALERPIDSDQFYVLLFLRHKQVDVLNDKDGIHWTQGVYV